MCQFAFSGDCTCVCQSLHVWVAMIRVSLGLELKSKFIHCFSRHSSMKPHQKIGLSSLALPPKSPRPGEGDRVLGGKKELFCQEGSYLFLRPAPYQSLWGSSREGLRISGEALCWSGSAL